MIRRTLVHVTTVPQSLWFLRGQAAFMRARGLEVHAVSSPGEPLKTFGESENVEVHPLRMERRITPLRDIEVVAKLWLLLRKIKPLIVDSHTPKGGLLGTLAARLAGVPVRIYHIHGLPFLTARGLRRALLRLTEKVSCRLASEVLCVSDSVRGVVVAEGLCSADKIKVLLSGSINGIDAINQFNPDKYDTQFRVTLRERYGIPEGATVCGFVGRIVRDKGLIELADAWTALRQEFLQMHLLLVGEVEEQDPIPEATKVVFEKDPRVHIAGHVDDMPPLYAIMDLVVLPSYREGFPLVLLESAAMGLPVVASDIPGCRDAVVGGVTGTLVPPHNGAELARAIKVYLLRPDLRREHGSAGRQRVLRDFQQEPMWESLYKEYMYVLERKRHLHRMGPSGRVSGH